jgi:hypothetical protein
MLIMGQERVCFTRAAVKRFGLDELAAWVDDPLPENDDHGDSCLK